jgi:Na+/H+ antiporter NhaD/arsenite permease-like protein
MGRDEEQPIHNSQLKAHDSLRLLHHPVFRTLVFERFLLTGSAALALAAVLLRRVSFSEIPSLMDWRLLSLFFVLTVAVELAKHSDLFDRLVEHAVARARGSRRLAYSLVGVTAALAALLTNDVALFLVVPFTMLFRRVEGFDRVPVVVLEVLAANLLGCATPIGNPQNLFLYTRGGFTPGSFFAAQAPFVAFSALLLALAVPVLVPARRLETPSPPAFDVDRVLASASVVLLALEIGSVFRFLPHGVPLAGAILGLAFLGRRALQADFSLVLIFAFLFVGVAGLERGLVYRAIAPERLVGHHASGMLLGGAILSQVVSNVPAALLLAPAASGAAGFRALLYGVNAGACGTPIAAIANLIGGQLYVRGGGRPGAFWRLFTAVSAVLLPLLILFCLALVRFSLP